jgi:nucleotide-binding universal stress UspA family protein
MKSIIYATDCSKNSIQALRYAYRFSLIMNANFHVLHVYDLPPVNLAVINSKKILKKHMQEEQKNLVENYCAKHLKHEFRQKPIHIHVSEGASIAKHILSLSEKLKPDLVILGMKDHHSTRGYFSGNIANSLLQKIKSPLLIVPNNVSYNSISTIIYATDFEEKDIDSVKRLIEIAKPFSALIEVVHVYKKNKTEAKAKMEKFKNIVLQQSSYPEITFNTIASEDIKSGLLNAVKNEKASLVAMLERKQSHNFSLFIDKDLVQEIEESVSVPVLAFT